MKDFEDMTDQEKEKYENKYKIFQKILGTLPTVILVVWGYLFAPIHKKYTPQMNYIWVIV